MVDTNRTLVALQALLADNTAGDISPQDLRDAIYSLFRNASKGDLTGIDASGLLQALSVSGNDGWVLTEDAASTLGWKWASAGAGSHPDLATHDALGLATDAELSTHEGTADAHHATDHDHDGAPTQKLLAANTHESPSADTHHAQSHAHNGADSSGTVAHSATTGKTANDHHNQSHGNTDHTSTFVTQTEIDTSVSTHAGLADPHTGYRLDSADHSHQSTGLQGGQLDHGAALTGLTDDDHTQYVLRSILTTNGDIFIRSAGAVARLGIGSDGQTLRVSSGAPAWGTPFIWLPIAHWFIGGPLKADTTNHQGAVIPLPTWATAATLVEGSSIKANVATAPTGATIELDIKHSSTWAGTQTSIFATGSPDYVTIATSKNEISETGSDDGTLTTTTFNGGFFRLFARQVGSTERGRDLTVDVFAKVWVEF